MPTKRDVGSQRSTASREASNQNTSSALAQISPNEVLAMFPECQCGQTDTLEAPILCPLHYTLPMATGRPAMSLATRSMTVSSVDSGSPPNSPPGPSPNDQAHNYRFTPPMSLEDFPRPASINRGESLATVLQERYHRRKAQNRTAQRAYRDREKHRLSLAIHRVREMESELQSSIDMQKHWQALYETLFAEYEKLWNEINMLTATPLSLSRTSSMSEVAWIGNMGDDTGQGDETPGARPC